MVGAFWVQQAKNLVLDTSSKTKSEALAYLAGQDDSSNVPGLKNSKAALINICVLTMGQMSELLVKTKYNDNFYL